MGAYADDPVLLGWLDEPERLIAAGGKRIRPLMLLLGYRLAGGTEDDAAFEAAVALELFHLFALVHDDVMDRGLERHGVPTVHRAVEERLRALGRRGDLVQVAASQATIIGDLLFSWAFEAFVAAPFPPERRAAGLEAFFRMSDEVMAGQMLDIDLTTRTASSRPEMFRKMALKTAGYTFIRPLQIGIALAGGGEAPRAFAERFGLALGTAFQIQDDLQDAFADIGETGKTPLSDLRDHQHSLLTQRVLDGGTEAHRDALRAAWGNPAIDAALRDRVRAAFVGSGAVDEAADRCLDERAAAVAALAGTAMPEPLRRTFEELLERAVSVAGLEALRAKARETYAQD